MAKKTVTKKNVEKEVEKQVEQEIPNEQLVSTGNKVRKATSFGAILKGIRELRKQRLAKFKDNGKDR